MSKSTALNITQKLKLGSATIVAADTSTVKTVYSAGADDTVIKGLQIVSDDTTARVVNIYTNNGTTDSLLGAVSVAASSGTNGTLAAVDLLSGTIFPGLPYDANGKRIMYLPAGYSLKVSSQSTVTAAKTLTVTAITEDF